jgi:hypothetical protein
MKRSILIASGVVVLVLLLAGAAFMGAQMLSRPDEMAGDAEEGGSVRVMEIVADDGSGPVHLRIKIEPAPELPDRPAEVGGIFVRRQDNSIFVGTGDIELDVEVNGGTGERSVNLSHSGPEVEVVVTRDTIIYWDETEISTGDPSERKSGELTIQQVIRPIDSLEEVGKNTELQVWGERRGDRVVAEVLVYQILDEF